MEELQQALSGGHSTPPPKVDLAAMLATDDPMLNVKIQELFDQYAGADKQLQAHEVAGLSHSLIAHMHMDRGKGKFADINELFARFDRDHSGSLNLPETISLVKFWMKTGVNMVNQLVDPGNGRCETPRTSGRGQVRMLSVWNDYQEAPPEWSRLDTKFAADAYRQLAQVCGIQDFQELSRTQATSAAVTAAIQEIGRRCGPDDHFVFYYTGHGALLPGNAEMDSCFCLLSAVGQCNPTTWMRDDEFAIALTSAIPTTTRVLVLSDSCHSGTICDFQKYAWDRFEAISMSGCKDEQVSSGTGTGGVFSKSVLNSIRALQGGGSIAGASVGLVYNKTVTESKQTFHGAQDVTLQHSKRGSPATMAWPLVPVMPY